jgi:nucleoside-diphosphate-sugar epimerase
MIHILGGNGFVGSAFVRLFGRLGLEYRNITRDNYSGFVGTSCDVLINANGNSSKILAKNDPMTDFRANVESTRKLLNDMDCGFYIHLSSCDVYPDCSSPSLTREDDPIDLARQSPYGFHKYLSELCAQALRKNWLVIRQGGFVGPGMKKNAIFDILGGGKLWLHPGSELQFLHTDDSAAIIWDLFGKSVRNETVNVCGDGTVRLEDAIRWSGKTPEPDANARPIRYEVDIRKLHGCGSRIPSTVDTVKEFVRRAASK